MSLARRAARRLVRGNRRWGERAEVRYWRHYLATQGDAWPGEYTYRLDPDAEVNDPALADTLPPGKDPVHVLDVGAGPLTTVGRVCEGRRVDVTATDALGEAYAELLAQAGVTPPTPTLACPGEQLLERFAADSFDVAYARNALDHAEDPLKIISNMLVLAPVVLLRHTRNEAERQDHTGLHQWDFDIVDGRPVARGANHVHDLGALGAAEAWLEDPDDEAPWVVVRLRREDAS